MTQHIDTVTISAREYTDLLHVKSRVKKIEAANQVAREAMRSVMKELTSLRQCQDRMKSAFEEMTRVWQGEGLENK